MVDNKKRNGKKPTRKKEQQAVVLDYLSRGYVKSDMSKFGGKPIAQAIGTEQFTLLELIPKHGVDLEIGDTVYIGANRKEKTKIHRVLGLLDFEKLTATSRIELDYSIRDIVTSNEEKYVNFFNTTGAISTRLHTLELIPGIGKKYMWDIINAREEKPFESFADITERLPTLTDPAGMIVNRVKQELDKNTVKRGKSKYYIFTQVPRRPKTQK
ncbi:MAG: DUF655 domain-containing protein [Methanobacteriaceae archaeon]|nr:DUF655 domain-containing protein [Methanobacteriaceae archaeon]